MKGIQKLASMLESGFYGGTSGNKDFRADIKEVLAAYKQVLDSGETEGATPDGEWEFRLQVSRDNSYLSLYEIIHKDDKGRKYSFPEGYYGGYAEGMPCLYIYKDEPSHLLSMEKVQRRLFTLYKKFRAKGKAVSEEYSRDSEEENVDDRVNIEEVITAFQSLLDSTGDFKGTTPNGRWEFNTTLSSGKISVESIVIKTRGRYYTYPYIKGMGTESLGIYSGYQYKLLSLQEVNKYLNHEWELFKTYDE